MMNLQKVNCLATDASFIVNDDLDEMVDGLTYHEARRTVHAVERQTKGLRRLMGDDFDLLVWADREIIEQAR